ncbi:MAG: radical SAM protein [Nitrospirae bacterium]|nr:radical SAM protein [Nitrospirota bacterium]
MKIEQPPLKGTSLTLTKNLIVLEKGKNELLLVNSIDPRPLYIKRGRDYIKRFLESVKELGAAEKIKKAYPQDTELLNMLISHRIIITSDDQRKGLDKTDTARDRKARDDKNGMSLYLLLSQSCNLGCIYCLNGIKTYKKDKNLMMKEEVAYRSIERCLDSINPGGKLEIVFFGGEPLLNWPLAKKVITHCEKNLKERYKDKEILYHLTSNLTILPPDLIEWAKRYKITFLCDIDGPEDIHNECRPYKNGRASHALIVKNIKRLTKSGLRVALRSTITAKNQDCMLEIAKHHKSIGGIGSAFVPVNPVNSDEDILPETVIPSTDKLIKGLSKVYKSRVWDTKDLFPFNVYASHVHAGGRAVRGCGAPYGNTPVVDVNGDVYPCIYLVGIKRFYMGNIMNGSYPDNNILDWMMDFLHVDNMAECRGCAWRYICGGGCPVGKLTVLENSMASRKTVKYCNSLRCDYTKKVIELLLWDLAKEAAASVKKGVPNKATGAIDNTINC